MKNFILGVVNFASIFEVKYLPHPLSHENVMAQYFMGFPMHMGKLCEETADM